jgi:DNA-binding MarR family transcriptional regulator
MARHLANLLSDRQLLSCAADGKIWICMKQNTNEKIRFLSRRAGSLSPALDEHEDLFRQFVHATMAFASRMQVIRKALGSAIGLSGTQYTILISIARRERKGGVGLTYISERLHFTPAFATIEINKLVAAGLVNKKENPDDRRRVLLSITPRARQLLRSLKSLQGPANNLLFEGLTPGDLDSLRDKMEQLANNANRALQFIEFLANDSRTSARDE